MLLQTTPSRVAQNNPFSCYSKQPLLVLPQTTPSRVVPNSPFSCCPKQPLLLLLQITTFPNNPFSYYSQKNLLVLSQTAPFRVTPNNPFSHYPKQPLLVLPQTTPSRVAPNNPFSCRLTNLCSFFTQQNSEQSYMLWNRHINLQKVNSWFFFRFTLRFASARKTKKIIIPC